MQNDKTGIQKYHLWLLFFFVIFGFTFSMIIWTVKSAVSTPAYEDRSFMSSYQDVDENYNILVTSNEKFNRDYQTEVTINNRTVGMEFSDILYGQRSLEKMSKNHEMLTLGENRISIKIMDNESQEIVSNAKIEFQMIRPIDKMSAIVWHAFKLSAEGNWNILGKITIGEDIGYLYIKTKVKK